MNKMHKSKGITLVSLVITIILLLILASISIQALTNTGLFESTFKAKKEAKRGQIEEWLSLKLLETQTTSDTSKTAEQIIEATRQNVNSNISELKAIGKDVTVEETSTEEDGEQVEIYFYVIVDKDVFKVSLKEKGFIGELGKFPPVIKIESYSKTTNSITVQVATKRNEGGELKYYIKGEDNSEYQLKATKADTETTHTFEELEQNKNYSIKIVAIAENEQTAEVTKDVNLGSVPDLAVGDITFTYTVDGVEINENTWTNKAVNVTANTDEQGFTLQTSKDAHTWNSVKNQIFTENGQMHVRLWDGKNAGGTATANVTNIDTLEPNAFTPTTSSTTKSITVTASTEDADATDTSGCSGIAGYRFKLDSGTWTDYQASGTYTWDDLAQTTDHTITVEAKDNAGNTTTGTATKGTGTVTQLTTADTTFTYKIGEQVINDTTWTNQNVTVTVNTTVTGYTLQTSTNGQNWSNETSQTFTQNGTVHARLWDGKNGGGAATANVTNIDTLAPKAFTPTTSSTTKSITVTASTEDADAIDTSGSSGIAGYRFKLDSGTWTDYQASGTYTWDDLAQTTDHTITVEAKDNAGNTTTGTATKGTGTIEQPTTATCSPTTWTSGSVTVTLPPKTGYTIRYTTNGTVPTKTSTEYSAPFTVSSNCVINFAYSDGTNVGTAQTANINNIDTIAPTISTALSSTSKGIDSVTLSVGITDANSGLGKVEWYYGTTNDPTTLAGTTPVTDLNGSATGPTDAQTKTYTVSGLAPGTTYWFKVIAYDVAGKTATSTIISVTTDNPTAADISYTPSDTSWGVDNVKSALDSLYSR